MRLTSCKIGTAGSKAMKAYLEQMHDDKVLLIQCPRLEKSCRNAAWVKALQQVGVGHTMVGDGCPAATDFA